MKYPSLIQWNASLAHFEYKISMIQWQNSINSLKRRGFCQCGLQFFLNFNRWTCNSEFKNANSNFSIKELDLDAVVGN